MLFVKIASNLFEILVEEAKKCSDNDVIYALKKLVLYLQYYNLYVIFTSQRQVMSILKISFKAWAIDPKPLNG